MPFCGYSSQEYNKAENDYYVLDKELQSQKAAEEAKAAERGRGGILQGEGVAPLGHGERDGARRIQVLAEQGRGRRWEGTERSIARNAERSPSPCKIPPRRGSSAAALPQFLA